MKAIVQERYGSPDVLELQDIAKPAVGESDVLVRVQAAAVHPGDVLVMRGRPFFVRLMGFGLFKPKIRVRGLDLAGRVEAVGSGVERLEPGDEVFGECEGALAEYVCGDQDRFVPKPASLSFQQAAAVPVSGLAALHAMRDVGAVQPGQKVLINGASGGLGTFAVQIAKAFGAEVTGVCSARNVEMVRSIGADHVIDYTEEDFTQTGTRYDLILDNVENRPLSEVRRALTREGMLVLNSGTGSRGMAMVVRLLRPLVLSPFVRHKLRRYVSEPSLDDLLVLKELIEEGKVEPVIEKTYPLSEAAEAMRHIEAGHASGKVVVEV